MERVRCAVVLAVVLLGVAGIEPGAARPLRTEVPSQALRCLESGASRVVLVASYRSEGVLDYLIVGYVDGSGEGGGQALVTLKDGRCRLLGADNVVWPLTQWGLSAAQARALALDSVEREIARTKGGRSELQRRFNKNPSSAMFLAEEQKWAYGQKGILPEKEVEK